MSSAEIWLRAIFCCWYSNCRCEILANRVAQLGLGREAAKLLQEILGQLGQLQLLDVQHFELEVDFLAAQLVVRRVLAQRDFGRAAVAALHALHQLVEAFEPRIAEAQRRTNSHDRFGLMSNLLPVGLRRDVHRYIVAFGRRAFERHQLAVAREHLLELLVDVGIGELAHRPVELQALPLRHVELGPHFDRELERHRPFFGHFDGFQIEVRLADRREPLLLADLLQAVEQQRAFHLVGDFIAKAVLDDLPRCAADPEARHGGRRHHLAERIVEVALDIGPGDRHRHVPLARARAGHLNIELKLLLRPPLRRPYRPPRRPTLLRLQLFRLWLDRGPCA